MALYLPSKNFRTPANKTKLLFSPDRNLTNMFRKTNKINACGIPQQKGANKQTYHRSLSKDPKTSHGIIFRLRSEVD